MRQYFADSTNKIPNIPGSGKISKDLNKNYTLPLWVIIVIILVIIIILFFAVFVRR
tara:strand:+ start:84 stop:251 length:168 start_codon:yes stop_codon:yes gene_type:complete